MVKDQYVRGTFGVVQNGLSFVSIGYSGRQLIMSFDCVFYVLNIKISSRVAPVVFQIQALIQQC